jgi:hypothetical protein
MPSPFESCWDRIRRAHAHRDAFADIWNKIIDDEQAYDAWLDMEDDGTGTIYVSSAIDLPPSLSLELGETIYQLRAALDGAVYIAATFDSGQNPPPDENWLEFPIADSPADFKKRARYIAPLADERKRIVESVQPYNAPKLEPELQVYNFNRALGILNDWARIDRHRRLHIIGAWASNVTPLLRFPDGVKVSHMTVTSSGFLGDKTVIAKFALDGYRPGMNVQANPNLSIDVAVGEVPRPCADSDTLGTRIFAMLRAADHVVGKFEESFGFE